MFPYYAPYILRRLHPPSDHHLRTMSTFGPIAHLRTKNWPPWDHVHLRSMFTFGPRHGPKGVVRRCLYKMSTFGPKNIHIRFMYTFGPKYSPSDQMFTFGPPSVNVHFGTNKLLYYLNDYYKQFKLFELFELFELLLWFIIMIYYE